MQRNCTDLGLCMGPLALFCSIMARINLCYDLAKAAKASDGKKNGLHSEVGTSFCAGVPSAGRNGLSGDVLLGVCHCPTMSLMSQEGDVLRPMAVSDSSPLLNPRPMPHCKDLPQT